MTGDERRRRPVVVTLAVILVTISGVIDTGMGILILLSRYQVDADDVLTVSLLGAGVILFGLLTLAVASGIARGSRLSRLLVTLYLAVELPLHLITIIATDPWDWSSTLDIVLDLALLALLWVPPGSRHFTSRAPAPDPLTA
ncbi:MAG: hypothetical protein QM626_10110 [Microbacterium sp.]|uniref:hypothetical protein n=1 Tax=Microbacterium sp. TaxID=51671 RepID=UPI0039E22D01